MNAKRLFIPLAIALAVLGAYNVGIALTAHTTQRRQMLAKVDHLPPEVNCVFLGNSLVEAGCDPDAFTAALPATEKNLVPVNLGLGATTPVEHYLIWERALQSPTFHPKYLVYGFFDDQLNAVVRGDWSDLIGNRAFDYYFPQTAAGFYAPGSKLAAWQLQATAKVPMLAERSSLWTKIEHLRRDFEAIGMPKQKVTRFGRVGDFTQLEANDIESFNHRMSAIVNGHVGFSKPVQEIFRLAQERGIKVILVEMPMPTRHRERFYSTAIWPQMRAYLQSLAATQHLTYLSAADWVRDDSDFEDAMHLSPDGAKVFSAEMAQALAKLDAKPIEVAGR